MVKTQRVVITPGEPAGIGPDLVVQLAQREWPVELVVCADATLLTDRAAMLGLPLTLRTYSPNSPAQPQTARLSYPLQRCEERPQGRVVHLHHRG